MIAQTNQASCIIPENEYFNTLLPNLSQRACRLWGKTSRDNQDIWVPLYVHLGDTAAIAEIMWERWVPNSSKNIIIRSIRETNQSISVEAASQQAKQLFLACAVAHDLGKATPVFQIKAQYLNPGVFTAVRESGLGFGSINEPTKIPHSLASQIIVERHGWSKSLSVVLGGHHGKPPSMRAILEFSSYNENSGFDNPDWIQAQNELYEFTMKLIGLQTDDLLHKTNINPQAQVILTGLIIMADWLASDESRFSYLQIPVLPDSLKHPCIRAQEAWDELLWPTPLKMVDPSSLPDFFEQRFGFAPRPVQKAVVDVLISAIEPGIVIIEAPMGEGKTEAAFAAAEILAAKTGASGAFVALPTQATSDGMFPRALRWLNKLYLPESHTMFLAHGKAQFNQQYQDLAYSPQIGIDAEEDEDKTSAYVDDWFTGKKRGILADFVVGTIDQILLGGLKQKHLALRHLALANKVVIIDECHAYDAYMGSYLYTVLAWLGAYQIPTVVLSATLTNSRRKELIDAYLNTPPVQIAQLPAWCAPTEPSNNESLSDTPEWEKTTAYPLITYTDGYEVRQHEPGKSNRTTEVIPERLNDDDLLPKLKELLIDGGCVGIIVNTVRKAQMIAELCAIEFGEDHVELHHSQFIAQDRIAKENALREKLGSPADNPERPPLLIVVGTQVLEQSLDIDFDVLISDICPMDLFIQRIGRMHRHAGRNRPAAFSQARCFVMGIIESGQYDSGSEAIYTKYLLLNTDLLLPETIHLPDDISGLVQQAYAEEGLEDISLDQDQYRAAFDLYTKHVADQNNRATTFQINRPDNMPDTLVSWLDSDVKEDKSGKRGEATVRDSSDSIDVLVIQRLEDGTLRLLPWLCQDNPELASLPLDHVPTAGQAIAIARCSVKLPAALSAPWIIDATINELEQNNMATLPECWQESPWLRGELFLVLDENLQMELSRHLLSYTKDTGLSVERREDEY